ncbi:MAG: 6-pyruvoyl tetrahydrobiopterin synthase [Gammaproteobacteria bacterium]|jgi:6-pyruvoyltetrahydropterin/6-carboxytetrahydropterin synthase|nr:6-pyruvoyl tetrahydrobiopterin synthase [Gammaproteobacteria bacterium]
MLGLIAAGFYRTVRGLKFGIFIMKGYFTVKVLSDFSASHILNGYIGDCARLHGHNWKVELEVKVQASDLNEIGIGVDFKDLKKALRAVLDRVEHRHLNDIPPFNTINPTAENLSMWIYQEIKPLLAHTRSELQAVAIWETERAMTRYEESSSAVSKP